jgi:hypothetical protein
MQTEIKILHASCCGKQSPIKAQIQNIADQLNLNVHIEELTELSDTMIYGTMIFPSLVINGKVYDYKLYQKDEQLIALLKA